MAASRHHSAFSASSAIFPFKKRAYLCGLHGKNRRNKEQFPVRGAGADFSAMRGNCVQRNLGVPASAPLLNGGWLDDAAGGGVVRIGFLFYLKHLLRTAELLFLQLLDPLGLVIIVLQIRPETRKRPGLWPCAGQLPQILLSTSVCSTAQPFGREK